MDLIHRQHRTRGRRRAAWARGDRGGHRDRLPADGRVPRAWVTVDAASRSTTSSNWVIDEPEDALALRPRITPDAVGVPSRSTTDLVTAPVPHDLARRGDRRPRRSPVSSRGGGWRSSPPSGSSPSACSGLWEASIADARPDHDLPSPSARDHRDPARHLGRATSRGRIGPAAVCSTRCRPSRRSPTSCPFVVAAGHRRPRPRSRRPSSSRMPPAIRLTSLGDPHRLREFARGRPLVRRHRRQMLRKVQLPLAKPSVMLGVNQTHHDGARHASSWRRRSGRGASGQSVSRRAQHARRGRGARRGPRDRCDGHRVRPRDVRVEPGRSAHGVTRAAPASSAWCSRGVWSWWWRSWPSWPRCSSAVR